MSSTLGCCFLRNVDLPQHCGPTVMYMGAAFVNASSELREANMRDRGCMGSIECSDVE